MYHAARASVQSTLDTFDELDKTYGEHEHMQPVLGYSRRQMMRSRTYMQQIQDTVDMRSVEVAHAHEQHTASVVDNILAHAQDHALTEKPQDEVLEGAAAEDQLQDSTEDVQEVATDIEALNFDDSF